jgi:mannose-6-phosphate isomerase-like protein (cupin superfamily)
MNAPIDLDDLPHSERSHSFVGADHGGVPVCVILVHTPRGAGPELHRHPYPEVFVLEAGEATFTVGEDEVVARGGQIVIAPANTWHGFKNTGGGELRLTAIHAAASFDTEWLGDADPAWASTAERT